MKRTSDQARSWLRITVAALLALAAGASASGMQSPSLRDDPRVQDAVRLLETWIDAELDYERLPGISMAVVRDQELVWSRGFGFAHLGSKTAADPDTIYSICSISKLFTSIAVLQLRDQGKLRLDDPLSEHLSWFDIENTYPHSGPITIRGILTHSAGLPRESDHPYWTGPEFPFPSRGEIIETVSNQKTLYPASRYFQYSNLGLTLAGEIVSAVSGRPYDDYVRANILEPLHLADTTPYLPEEHRGGRLATGYGVFPREGGRAEMPFFQANGIAPAAGYASTAEDLARFASWQFRLLNDGPDEVLKSSTLREMQRVQWVDPDWKTTWGLGFSIWRDDETTFVGHGGSCPGFRTQLLLSPKDKVATVFMTNAMGVDTRSYAQKAYEIVAPALDKALKDPDHANGAPEELERYTGIYRSAWGETAVLTWEGSLATVDLPTRDPVEGLSKLRHVEGHRFRRIRKDDELGEEVVFTVDENGMVTRLQTHGNFMEKQR